MERTTTENIRVFHMELEVISNSLAYMNEEQLSGIVNLKKNQTRRFQDSVHCNCKGFGLIHKG